MAKLQIQIKIRKRLKPSTPTPNHLQRLNLSLFDPPNPSLYVPVLLHYLPSSELNTAESIRERCDKLQKSLAEALAKFYPLAGRYNNDDMSIHCNDDGVEYVETQVNADLAEFLNEGPNIKLLNDLLPWDIIPKSDVPLFAIQVNIFNCGGLVMGIQFSHILADAFTLATVLNEWSHIVQTGTTNKGCLSSFGYLPSLFPMKAISRVVQYSPSPDIVTQFVTRRFVFDALSIEKLKHKINSSAPFVKSSTGVVVVMSLIWKALVAISSAKHGHPRDSTILFAMNLRGRSNVPSTEHALGNFCLISNATVEANQSIKELNDFVNLVGGTIRDTSVAIGKAGIDETSSMLVNSSAELLSKYGRKDEMDIYVITSWCKIPWYEADFGWGKPFWVSCINYDGEVIILLDTKDGDGIEAWVSLKENDMAEFERDPDILTCCLPQKKQLIPQ